MGRKLSLISALLCSSLISHNACAETPPSSKPFQFYGGVSLGVERMEGSRSESVSEDNANLGNNTYITTTYSNNKTMKGNNAVVSALAGFLSKISTTSFYIGPELYVGRGNTKDSLNNTHAGIQPTLGGGYNVYYSTSIQRKYFYGALIRLGYKFCNTYLGSVSIGIERGQFLRKRVSDNYNPDALPTTINKTKNINGFLLGVGLEKNV